MKRKVNLLSEYDNPSLADPGTKKLPWRGGCTGVGFKESQRRRLMYCRNHATLYECSIQGGVRLTEESVTRVECNKQFGTRVVHPCLSPATFLFCQTKIVDSARCPSNIKKGSWVHLTTFQPAQWQQLLKEAFYYSAQLSNLAIKYIQPVICYSSNCCINFFQGGTMKKRFKH